MLTDLLAPGRDAVATFLTTLLGEDLPFAATERGIESAREAATRLEGGLVLKATSGRVSAFVRLDDGYLALFSQAMLGDALKPGDEGADDLLKELAAQAYGAIQSSLSGNGFKAPDLTFEPAIAEEAIGALPAQVAVIDAEVTTARGPLRAALLISVPSPSTQPAESRAPVRDEPQRAVNVAPAAFPELGTEGLPGGDGAAFGLLAEVELEVTVELGRRRLALADVLRLTTGSVIELEKLVGEPLQVYANNRLIAEGEAVVIDEQFGIRITNLISNPRRTKAFI